jgi:hypothetical protein
VPEFGYKSSDVHDIVNDTAEKARGRGESKIETQVELTLTGELGGIDALGKG